ncbi:hypothetical protein [Photobacterium leiognathi]|uniref:hypothetical protein n=1 Tax=Photobacterium leiognathi TaxID=553611 RepID=UPI0029817EC6|nr:hypothetical protein [Photobacterium leiognathi]
MELLSLIVVLIGSLISIIALLSKCFSVKKLKKKRKEYEKEIIINSYYRYSKKVFDESNIEKILSSKNYSGISFDKYISELIKEAGSEIESPYTTLNKTHEVLQVIGRANRLKEKKKGYRKIWFLFNSGLLDSIVKSVIYNEDKSSINKNTVIGMLVGNKMKQDTKSYLFIIGALLLHVSFSLFGVVSLNYWLMSFLLFMFSGLTLNQKVLEYRIRNGFYGTNEYEAREIISFIDQNADDNDFGNGGDKKLFQETDKFNSYETGIYGGLFN